MLLGRPAARLAPAEAAGVAAALRQLGPGTVILKMGDRGCFHDGRQFACFPVEVRDATAAGDTFNGALAVALAEGQTMEQALRFANAAAAISVTRLGAQASIPTRAEVDAFLAA